MPKLVYMKIIIIGTKEMKVTMKSIKPTLFSAKRSFSTWFPIRKSAFANSSTTSFNHQHADVSLLNKKMKDNNMEYVSDAYHSALSRTPTFSESVIHIPIQIWFNGMAKLFYNLKDHWVIWKNVPSESKCADRNQIEFMIQTREDLRKVPIALMSLPFFWMLMPLLKKFPTWYPSTMWTSQIKSIYYHSIEKKRQELSEKILMDFDHRLETRLKENPNDSTLKQYKSVWMKLKSSKDPLFLDLLELSSYFVRYQENIIQVPDSTISLWSQFLFDGVSMSKEKNRARIYQWIDWIVVDDLLLRAQGTKGIQFNKALWQRGYSRFFKEEKIVEKENHSRTMTLDLQREQNSLLKNHIQFTTQMLTQFEATPNRLPVKTEVVLKMQPPQTLSTMAAIYILARALNITKYRSL